MSDRYLRRVPIFRTAIAEVADVRCIAPKSSVGCEEYSENAVFIFPRRGVFEWHSEGTVALDCTTALYVGGGQVHRIGHPTPGGDDCTTLRIAPDVLSEALDSQSRSLRAVMLSPTGQRGIQLLLVALRTQSAGALTHDELALAALRLICAERGATVALHDRCVKEVAEVRCLIASNPEQDLALAQVARAVNVSPYHLARRFRAVTGTSIAQYRTRHRLALAVERITEGWTDLSTLALDLGFAHHSHFTSTFRKAYGIPPSELRRLSVSQVRERARPKRARGPITDRFGETTSR